jgi:hypothetical protein
MGSKTATFYVTLRADRASWGNRQSITKVKAVTLRQSKGVLQADEIAVKVSVVVPDAAFEPFVLPAVTLDVTPAELVALVEEAA